MLPPTLTYTTVAKDAGALRDKAQYRIQIKFPVIRLILDKQGYDGRSVFLRAKDKQGWGWRGRVLEDFVAALQLDASQTREIREASKFAVGPDDLKSKFSSQYREMRQVCQILNTRHPEDTSLGYISPHPQEKKGRFRHLNQVSRALWSSKW